MSVFLACRFVPHPYILIIWPAGLRYNDVLYVLACRYMSQRCGLFLGLQVCIAANFLFLGLHRCLFLFLSLQVLVAAICVNFLGL